jgi:branched-chain amino acid aminotransferase
MMKIAVTKTQAPKVHPPESELGFGKFFSDHMFVIDFDQQNSWHDARIVPYGPFQIDPAASVFHYGQAMFEGAKAFKQVDGSIKLFRPKANAQRMATGAPRLSMQCPSIETMVESMKAIVRTDADWVPNSPGTALYLRPTLIATEGFLGVRPATKYTYFVIASPVGNYYGGQGLKTVKIWVEMNDVRAPKGGLGSTKAGANYAASLNAAQRAKKDGYDQVLWLDGKSHEYVEEVGTMNVFFVFKNTLVTPPLSDSILAGVTRDSVIALGADLGLQVQERPVSIAEIKSGLQDKTLSEVFGVGTAAVVSPVGELSFGGERVAIGGGGVGPISQKLYDTVSQIQRGSLPDRHGWLVPM